MTPDPDYVTVLTRYFSLKPPERVESTWEATPAALDRLSNIRDGNGRPIVAVDPLTFVTTLLGRPVWIVGECDDPLGYRHIAPSLGQQLAPNRAVRRLLEREYMTIGEIAQRIGVSPRTVLRWTEQGHLAAIRLPGRGQLRVRVEDYDQFIADAARRGPSGEKS